MELLGWLLITVLFVVGLAGAIYPILPGALAIYGAFFIYGWFFGFESFGLWFWFIQTTIVVVIIVADYAVSALGIKKFGGTKASVIGSTLGLVLGPFVIPVAGLIAGPFLGAFLGELSQGASLKQAGMVGIGSLVGLFSSMLVKVLFQIIMILSFFLWIFAN